MKAFLRELGILLFATMPMTVCAFAVGYSKGFWQAGLVFPLIALAGALYISPPRGAVRR